MIKFLFKFFSLLLVLMIAAFMAHFLYVKGMFDFSEANPYQKDDICFVKDFPGATDRYVQFTAVRCSDPNQQLAEAVGADFASLSFEDVDRDGQEEVIVKSSPYRCRYGGMGCYDAYRIILKVCPTCSVKVKLMERQFLQDLSMAHH